MSESQGFGPTSPSRMSRFVWRRVRGVFSSWLASVTNCRWRWWLSATGRTAPLENTTTSSRAARLPAPNTRHAAVRKARLASSISAPLTHTTAVPSPDSHTLKRYSPTQPRSLFSSRACRARSSASAWLTLAMEVTLAAASPVSGKVTVKNRVVKGASGSRSAGRGSS